MDLESTVGVVIIIGAQLYKREERVQRVENSVGGQVDDPMVGGAGSECALRSPLTDQHAGPGVAPADGLDLVDRAGEDGGSGRQGQQASGGGRRRTPGQLRPDGRRRHVGDVERFDEERFACRRPSDQRLERQVVELGMRRDDQEPPTVEITSRLEWRQQVIVEAAKWCAPNGGGGASRRAGIHRTAEELDQLTQRLPSDVKLVYGDFLFRQDESHDAVFVDEILDQSSIVWQQRPDLLDGDCGWFDEIDVSGVRALEPDEQLAILRLRAS